MRRIAIAESIKADHKQTKKIHDRRAGFRVQTVMRVGHVVASCDEGLVLVMNLSDDGARLHIGIPVRQHEELTLSFSEGHAMQVKVIWTRGPECGVRFEHSIDCADLLSRTPCSVKQPYNRPLRLNVSKPAVIRSEVGLLLGALEDVSHGGMKIRHDGKLAKNMVIKVTLPSGLSRSGVVRWSRDNIAGVLLLEPFRTEELGSSRAL